MITSWQTGVFGLVMDPPRLRSTLVEMGPWGYVVFVLAFAFLQPFGLPGIAFVLAATYVWPRPIAYGLSLVGSLSGSAVGFGFARFVAHDWVAARLPARLHKYDAWIERRGFLAVAGLRAIFLMHPLLHALFGVSRLRFGPYMLGCAIGYIPALAVVTWVSGSFTDWLGRQPKERFVMIAVAGALLMIGRRIVTHVWKKRGKDVSP